MNSYTLSQMEKGLTESFTITITEEHMQLFCQLSGDVSPIHMDAQYAAQRGFPGKVCYGMLGASFFSTLAGVYLLHSVESKFVKPVFIGDTLTITGVVDEVNDTFGEVTIKATITNQDGKKVTRGIIKAGVAK